MYLYILSLVRNEHTISPPIYKYLFLLFSSLILSKSVFPSKTALLKAPDNAVLKQDSLLTKKISKDFAQKIVFSSSETSPNFCTLIRQLFCKVTP